MKFMLRSRSPVRLNSAFVRDVMVRDLARGHLVNVGEGCCVIAGAIHR